VGEYPYHFLGLSVATRETKRREPGFLAQIAPPPFFSFLFFCFLFFFFLGVLLWVSGLVGGFLWGGGGRTKGIF